jgi:predicted nucleic acid-binding protein
MQRHAALVIDTAIMIDIALPHRPRHSQAARLVDFIREKTLQLYLPMHGFFELSSAINSEKRKGKLFKFSGVLTENNPLEFQTVPIDQAFITKYMINEVPNLSAGDMIFVVFAKVDKLDLVTEDGRMYQEARRLGVSVYTIDQYLKAKS